MKKRFFAVVSVLIMALPFIFGIQVTAQYDYDYYDYYDYDYDDDYIQGSDDYDGSFNWGTSILIAVVVGLVAAGITTGVMYSQLKNVKLQARAEEYVVAGSMNVTVARDLFLYQHTTRVARPKKNK